VLANAGERRPVVIGNGAEGEPASAKDRTLLTRAPHLVLDGLQLAAEAVGAGSTYLYVAGDLADQLRGVLATRTATGWDRVKVDVVVAPETFLAGEESTAVSWIEGKPALPRDKVRLVVESGVRRAPTLVQNVETLAHLALLARYGPDWFRQAGTAAEPGTFLATLSGAVSVPGVYEVPYGIPLSSLLARAGGQSAPLRGVLVGGYHGTWLPPAVDPELSRAGLAPYGASPGAGVVVALPSSTCGLVESARVARYLADQSAGQCGPCLNGLPRLADTLIRLARSERDPGEHSRSRALAEAGTPHASSGLAAEVERLSGLVTGRGACHHPDGSVRFIRSALRVFANDIPAHLAGTCVVRRGHV
ncbi:MAG TPA: NADH-ubiquinone oxidoreductase-F iron-sulfur binding region domain-containing protein, partial [Rugosimonospora sp.]|nr:NADH-ubiquinone oxidoreductase-F iron-sulfur binding region domain-containing protein [Rugosimonospora sp.]